MNKNQCITVPEIIEKIMKFFEENKWLTFMKNIIDAT